MPTHKTLHIFCRVIDNFGDIGVCWRLSRQLTDEHGLAVTLWLDHLPSLQRLCAAVDPARDNQQVHGVTVRSWPHESGVFAPDDVGDIVIEAFACDLPSSYLTTMARRPIKPVWLNLEYLSAEEWVEGCHALPSPHPSLPLIKHFFFPGFTTKTGGLLRENGLFARRDIFQADSRAIDTFLASVGVQAPEEALKVSLFCYPVAPVSALFKAMHADNRPVLCLVPDGVATEPVSAFLQQPAKPGARATHGNLTVQVLPFVEQDDYDRLLWSCDLNFVRGEDSFVRAQWAARPFVWHIYPQGDNIHYGKLDAFLGRYTGQMPARAALDIARFHLGWNGMHGGESLPEFWRSLRDSLVPLRQYGEVWARQLSQQSDLAADLLRFIEKIG